ncbi:MAG TPA: response regulator transcription factor [Candidatus Polarisedimenticolia bacterium]|jgi:DNA-binding NarL/FixJ family response regulator|nr:response regulator transcription factor [Candidatus Polarisedimenticolia bacterium]
MRILIVDDDPKCMAAIKRILRAKRDHDVVWEAKNGEEAVRLSRSLEPDLILMDLAIPRICGLEAVRLIKEKQPGIQIIMMSAFGGDVYREAALSSGADGFIPKSQVSTVLPSLPSGTGPVTLPSVVQA